jgi:hypothetical protein
MDFCSEARHNTSFVVHLFIRRKVPADVSINNARIKRMISQITNKIEGVIVVGKYGEYDEQKMYSSQRGRCVASGTFEDNPSQLISTSFEALLTEEEFELFIQLCRKIETRIKKDLVESYGN